MIKKTKTFLLVFFVVVAVFIYPTMYFMSIETVEIKVTDTTMKDDVYLVFTVEEVFQNTDNWLFMKFNSSDYQNVLKKDSSYVIEVVGWRIPFLSSYRNIIEIKSLVD